MAYALIELCTHTCRLAAGLATATAVIAGAVYTQTSGFGFNLTKISKGFYSSVLALLSPDNSNAAVHSFISAALGIYSAVLLFGPHEVRRITARPVTSPVVHDVCQPLSLPHALTPYP